MLGGEGFIGRALTRALRAQGHFVASVDNLESQVHDGVQAHVSLASEFFVRDLCDADWWQSIDSTVSHFDTVFFLASKTGTTQSMWQAREYASSNLVSLAILNDLYLQSITGQISGVAQLTFDRLVLTSSRAVYPSCARDEAGQIISSSEDDLPNPQSVYGATKLGQEAIVKAGFQGATKIILRLQNVYGPTQSANNIYTGVIATFVARAMANSPLTLFSSDEVIRDFVFIDDVVDALVKAGMDPDFPSGTLNIGTGVPSTIKKVAETVIAKTKTDSQIEILSPPLGDPTGIAIGLANCAKADSLGIECHTTLEEGLSRTIDGFSNNGLGSISSTKVDDYVKEIRRKIGII